MRTMMIRMRAIGLLVLLLCIGLLLLPTPTVAYTPSNGTGDARPAKLYLKVNGQEILGSLGRENSIEILYFEHKVTTAREAGSGMATGRRQYQPLLIRKRIDKASPLLMKALTENSVVEGRIDFYRTNPNGEDEVYYQIAFRGGNICGHEMTHGVMDGAVEQLCLTFQTISWTYTDGGVTHEDTWSTQR